MAISRIRRLPGYRHADNMAGLRTLPASQVSEVPAVVNRPLLIGVGAVLGLLIALPAGFALLRPVTVLPRIELAPGYDLIDQTGSRFTSEDVRGAITLYSFTYTQCRESCYGVLEVMSDVQAALDTVDTEGLPVRLVTVGFDHRRDGPDALTAAAAGAGANPEIWTFVTGDSVRLQRAVRALEPREATVEAVERSAGFGRKALDRGRVGQIRAQRGCAGGAQPIQLGRQRLGRGRRGAVVNNEICPVLM